MKNRGRVDLRQDGVRVQATPTVSRQPGRPAPTVGALGYRVGVAPDGPYPFRIHRGSEPGSEGAQDPIGNRLASRQALVAPENRLNGLLTFVHVAEKRSFTAAAVQLGVSPSAASQSIRHLERRLGVRLLNRTTRNVGLTEAGVYFLQRLRPTLTDLLAVVDEVGEFKDRPAGVLRLNVLRSAGVTVLAPILRDFLAAYPEINVEVSVDDGAANIIEQGFDAGIRLRDSVDPNMVAVRMSSDLGLALVGSPEYFARREPPTHPREIAEHVCILYRFGPDERIWRWEFEKDGQALHVDVDGPMTVTDTGLMVQAAVDGVGLAYVVDDYVAPLIREGRLLRVLEDWSPRFPGYFLYYPSRLGMPRKLRAFVDFVQRRKAT